MGHRHQHEVIGTAIDLSGNPFERGNREVLRKAVELLLIVAASDFRKAVEDAYDAHGTMPEHPGRFVRISQLVMSKMTVLKLSRAYEFKVADNEHMIARFNAEQTGPNDLHVTLHVITHTIYGNAPCKLIDAVVAPALDIADLIKRIDHDAIKAWIADDNLPELAFKVRAIKAREERRQRASKKH